MGGLGYPGCGAAPLNQFTSAKSSSYIINGEHQKYGEWPQYIHLENDVGNGYWGKCGGTLVSPTHVITAAHCVKNQDTPIPPQNHWVIFGEDFVDKDDAHEQRIQVSKICFAPKYTHSMLRWDWAVLTLSKPVQFSDYIQPACLPKGNQRIETYGPNSRCYLVGVGAIAMNPSKSNPNTPDAVNAKWVNKLHAENVPCKSWGFGATDSDRVCWAGANGHPGDSCVGDSGGPILCLDQQKRWTLMASVSYGATFCEHSREAVYARTRMLLPEMQQVCGINFFSA